ncbi:cytidine deaminase [Fluviicola taffensis]|uniref:CMP/dCMP deaminase zinc-binding protein n=1 Tax=Fluviicola taffensis (strain DSM 16823 / NCIMB 13979 / RW262) TaxID=755732 RepID=F2IK97_FLUTR|nr:cytidine deaminase [Fluviicola taffensis]AEA44000.1 CMP/dCMP deaminase zinc-binding protein [Fluviicola taffensis DSM 16823]
MKKQLKIDYEWLNHWKELPDTEYILVEKAFEAAEDAYAPYSSFHVGAAVLLADGTIIKGNNQENIAYPSGLCAERVALFYAGANYPNTIVKTIVVLAKGDLIAPDECVSPCGSCRQVIAESEFRQKQDIRIVLIAQDGKTWIFNRIKDILVFPFGVK